MHFHSASKMHRVSCLFGLLLFVGIYNDVTGKRHGHASSSDGKIVGGYNTSITDVPYQAYLLLQVGKKYYQCGGSIISTTVVLTAAHCLTGVKRVFVRVGSTESNTGGVFVTTTKYTIHSKYNAATSDYDVGIITLQNPIRLDGTNTKAVTLADEGQDVPAGTNLLISGWGDTTENGETSTNLMAVQIPTVSNDDCRKVYGRNAITSRMICAGVPEGGKDSCQGDSGGPAVNAESGVQLGVVSFGTGCARPGVPGVYTNVSSVRTWIKTNAGV